MMFQLQVDIDLIDPDGVFKLVPEADTTAIMADDDDEGREVKKVKKVENYERLEQRFLVLWYFSRVICSSIHLSSISQSLSE